MSNPLADQIVVNFPQRGSRTENVRQCSTATSLADKRQGQRVPIQKPRRKSNNCNWWGLWSHIYFLYRQLFPNSSSSPEHKKTTNPNKKQNKTHKNLHTMTKKKNNKSLSKRKEVRKVHFHLQRLRKKVPYFSTNIKSQQIDQRMATVIKYIITAIWKGKINK